jgi:hypothetical protein
MEASAVTSYFSLAWAKTKEISRNMFRLAKPFLEKALRRWRILISVALIWVLWNPLSPKLSVLGWTFKGSWTRILELWNQFLATKIGTQALISVAVLLGLIGLVLFLFPRKEHGRQFSFKRAFWFSLLTLTGLLVVFLLEQGFIGIIKFLVFFGALGTILYVFKRAHVGLKMLGMFFLAILLAAICYLLIYIEWVHFSVQSIAVMTNLCIGIIAGVGLESIRWDRKVSGMGTVMAEPAHGPDNDEHHHSNDDVTEK